MQPHEVKGNELIKKFYFSITGVPAAKNFLNAKRCAIEACDIIIEYLEPLPGDFGHDINFWEQVKEYISTQ